MYCDVKVGDEVERDLAGVVMLLRVTAVDERVITCGAWTFDRFTGGEIDADLGWDGLTRYGSSLTGRVGVRAENEKVRV